MAEVRKVGNTTVNNGNGLFDNEGLIDNAVLKLNEAVKNLSSGNYIGFCGCVEQVAQMLICLKTSIKKDSDSMKAKVEELKRALRESGTEIKDVPIEQISSEGVADGTI